MTKNKVRIEVIDIQNEGECSIGQQVGDVYDYPEDRGKMCPISFHILYPWVMVMLSGGSFAESGVIEFLQIHKKRVVGTVRKL